MRNSLEERHGYWHSRTYRTWDKMRARCNNPAELSWYLYGGRGIKVCERWMDFRNFLADMGERPSGRTLDRIDCNKDYEPGNCRWATPQEQSDNRRAVVVILTPELQAMRSRASRDRSRRRALARKKNRENFLP